jgi:hypothetical protein
VAKQKELTRREFLGAAGVGLAASLQTDAATAPSPASMADEDTAAGDLARLRDVFLNPPDSAKPMTRWWWFGGAVTKEEITRELEMMREAGLRGVELQPVYPLEVDDPQRGIHNVRYFSQEWFDLLRHTAKEAKRLGLQFDFTLGSGWPYGGPFVSVEHSARRLRVLLQDVSGPTGFTWDLSPQLVGEERIVAVVASPVQPSQQPDIGRTRVITDQVREIITNNLRTGMGLDGWPVPEGEWRIMVFIDSPTGMQVKRPTVGMEGYVLDHFSREAMDLFLRAAGDRTLEELKSLGSPAIHSVFCDSLEVYGADWTPKFLDEFRKRRGYDLTRYLPALWQDAGPLTPHIRYDYHRTLSDLILDNFFRTLAEWSDKRGVKSRVQAHGAFGDIIEGYSIAHIPEGENIFFGDRYEVNLRHRRLASSAAHLYSKPVASAETYTWLRVPLFLVTLEMMKAATDATFLDGINQIVNHGYPYSPPQAGQPGWCFYASTLINHTNLWWKHYPHLTRYIQRTAALLQQGEPVNPIAVYLPLADVFAKFGSGALHIDVELENHMGKEFFDDLRRAGYDFDLINDRALERDARIDEGRLRVGAGTFSVVIIPGVRFMPPESLERLAEFAESGGTVVFVERLPEAAPGLPQQDERTGRLRATLRRFWGDRKPAPGEKASAGSGKALLVRDSAAVLTHLQAELQPDCQIVEAGDNSEAALRSARGNIGFLHRRPGSADLYFLSNVSNQAQLLRVRFAAGHRRPERWDMETGESDGALAYSFSAPREATGETTVVQLSLKPFESCFVVFGESREQPVITGTNDASPWRIARVGRQDVVSGRAEIGGSVWFETLRGKRNQLVIQGIPKPLSLDGPWTLLLGDKPAISLPALRSWNELPEGRTYSGWATYQTSFDIANLGRDIDWMIDLGRVHETAEAELNGVALGAAWKGARRLQCGNALKTGRNQLIVRVANLWIHHMKSLPPPDVSAVAETYGIRWGRYGEIDQKDLPPSGLLGPVKLVPLKRWTLKI